MEKRNSSVDDRVWEWVKEDIGNPIVLERKLREIQTVQREENRGKEADQETILNHKEELEADLKSLGALYLNPAMPKHIVDELIAEKSHALKLTTDELSKITQELQTPLNDATIQSLLLFSVTFQERLEEVKRALRVGGKSSTAWTSLSQRCERTEKSTSNCGAFSVHRE